MSPSFVEKAEHVLDISSSLSSCAVCVRMGEMDAGELACIRFVCKHIRCVCVCVCVCVVL